MEAISVDDAVAFLQRKTSVHGGSVYDHLTEILAKIISERSDDAIDLLETSYIIKRTALQTQHVPTDHATLPKDEKDVKKAKAFLSLLRAPEPSIDPETGTPVAVEPPNEYTCDDVMLDGSLFTAVGVGLPEEEYIGIALMIKRLGEDPSLQVASVRFFGKFFGLDADYFVFETTRKTTDEEETPTDATIPAEPASGANLHVYYVCNTPGDVFTRLPDVQPGQIQSARLLKRFLTGNLTADVSTTFPLFPGKEAEYLRAQIARIACATTLCPTGHYDLDEEGAVVKNEEVPDHSTDQLMEMTNWAHLRPHLKKQGRCELHVREAPEGEEAEFELTEEEQEEGPALLTTIDQNTPLEQGPRWTVISSSSISNLQHQVVGIRSNAWPGAVAVAKGGLYSNIYVGWGVKDVPYVPPPLPAILDSVDLEAWKEKTSLPPPPEEAAEEAEE